MIATEIDFPRGKGLAESTSKPALKTRKIKLKGLKRRKADDEDLFNVRKRKSDQIDDQTGRPARRTKKGRKQGDDSDDTGGKTVVIESMSLAKLPENILIYGCIQEITDYEIRVCIPGGIIAKVGITNISDAYTDLLEKFAENAESMVDFEVLKPSGMFQIGQYFPVKIVHKSQSELYGKTEVTASLNPRDIYGDIIPSYFLKIPHMSLVAAVKSIEDHGFVMDVGLRGVNAFLSKENAETVIHSVKGRKSLAVGQLVMCAIESVVNERSIKLTTKAKILNNFKLPSDGGVTLSSCIPGLTVSATVMDVSSKGLQLNILNEFDGFAARHHLKSDWDLPTSLHTIGDKVDATILYVHPMTNQISVTMKPKLNPKSMQNYWKNVKIGATIENCVVVGRDPISGLVFKLSNNMKAVASKKHLYDHKFRDDEDLDIDEKFAIGTKHKCRVRSFNFMERYIRITLRESLLNSPSILIDDLSVGSLVKGVVKKLTQKSAWIHIGFGLRGYIPIMHLTETAQLLHPEKLMKLFPIGKEIKCRVIKIDRDSTPSKVCLTHKKSLLNKKLKILDKYDSAVKDFKTEGVVALVHKKGLLIEFFNDVKGWIPIKLLSTYNIEQPDKVFHIGQIVTCSVVNVNVDREQMTCSLINFDKNNVIKRNNNSDLTIGQIVTDMKITLKSEKGLQLSSEAMNVTAFMPFGHLSDDVEACKQLSNALKVGDIIEEVVVFSKKIHFIIVSRKPTFVNAAKRNNLICTYEQLSPDMNVPVIINGFVSYGIFVELPGNIKGLVPKRFMRDGKLEEPKNLGFSIFQTVYARFVDYEEPKAGEGDDTNANQTKKLTFSLKLTSVWDQSFDDRVSMIDNYLIDFNWTKTVWQTNGDEKCQKLANFSVGQLVYYHVVNIDDTKIVCDVTFANRKGEQPVKGISLKSSLDCGQFLKIGSVGNAIILRVDFDNNCVDIMLSQKHVKQVRNSLKNKATQALKLDQIVKCTSVYISDKYVLVILGGHAPGVLTYVPIKRHYNDLTGISSLFSLNESYHVMIKVINNNTVIGVLSSETSNKSNFRKIDSTLKDRKSTKNETKTNHKEISIKSKAINREKVINTEIDANTSKSSNVIYEDITENYSALPLESNDNINEIEEVVKPSYTRVYKPREVLSIGEGFDWNIDEATPNLNNLNSLPIVESSSSDDGSDDNASDKSPKRKKSRRERNEEVRQREETLRRKEELMLDKNRKPETADDYELQVLATPNSSLVWLKYMAFLLENAEISKARAVGERALKTISFREEQEKLNVWKALLNLENLYGTVSSLDELFQRAIQLNEPIVIYSHLANIYADSNKTEQAEALYHAMLKKFRQNRSTWIEFGLFYMKIGRSESARKLMQRSLACLQQKDHIDVITKFAQLEFRFGDAEHGKTLFENVLANFSKRIDLWSVYIDMLVKYSISDNRDTLDSIRNIFERVITLKLSARKMKFFFKRYIDFETQYGDEDRVNRIRQKALEYVEAKHID